MKFKTTEEVVADIVAMADTAKTPAELSARIEKAISDRPESMKDLRLALLGFCAIWMEDAIKDGVDQETAFRIVASELEATSACYVRRLYEILGKEFSPARFAIMAYTCAEFSEWIIKAREIEDVAQDLKNYAAEGTSSAEEGYKDLMVAFLPDDPSSDDREGLVKLYREAVAKFDEQTISASCEWLILHNPRNPYRPTPQDLAEACRDKAWLQPSGAEEVQ